MPERTSTQGDILDGQTEPDIDDVVRQLTTSTTYLPHHALSVVEASNAIVRTRAWPSHTEPSILYSLGGFVPGACLHGLLLGYVG
jgi:hypothetical protein